MLGPFTQRSHPYFHPSVSVPHCLRRPYLPPAQLYFPKDNLILTVSDYMCVHVCVGGRHCVLHREPTSDAHTYAHSVMLRHCLICAWWQHRYQVVCSSLYDITEADTISTLSHPTHADFILFPCMHAFLATDAWYKILLDTLGNFTGRAISSYLFPTCWLPAQFTSLPYINNTVHFQEIRALTSCALWIKGCCKIPRVWIMTIA